MLKRLNAMQLIILSLLLLLVFLLGKHWLVGSQKKTPKPFSVLVTTETVAPSTLQPVIEALGTSASNESVALSATVTARVQALHFADGAHVRAGDVLVELDAAQARADVEEKRVQLVEEERQYRHLSTLIERKAVSQTDVEKQQTAVETARAQLQAAQARVQDYVIKVPFDGDLGVRKVSVGALVSPGTVVTTVDDISRIKVDFTVPEIFLPVLQVGLPVKVKADALGKQVFAGVVTFIDSRIDPVTRAVALRAQLDNDAGLLRPGMLLTVSLEQPARQALMVPERSVAPLRGEQFVFVVAADNKVQRRTVRLGGREAGRVEVTQGLAAGDVLVVDGGMSLQDGMAVTVKNTASTPANGQ